MKWLPLFAFSLLLGCSPSDEFSSGDFGVDLADLSDGLSSEDAGRDASDAVADLGPAVAASVFERGPFNVGHRRWDITYDADLEPGREVKLSVWYPTEDTDGPPGVYLINTQRTQVIGNASVGIEGEAPLMVFSHGNASMGEQSYFMTEFWASHGWVVVAPYHTGNTVFDVASGGGGISLEAAPLRPQDVSAALDAVYALDSSDPLAGKISDDVVLSGHSFGGFTTLASTGAEFAVDTIVVACAQPDAPEECSILDRSGVEEVFRAGFLDERIDVAIPQAPGGYFAFLGGIRSIKVPTLLMTGGLDNTLPAISEGDPIWSGLQGPHVRLDLLKGGHFTFSNMCELLPIEPVLNDGCGEEFISFDTAFELINAYSLAFARHVLWDDETHLDLLRGEDDRYGEHVELSYKPEAGLD